MQTDTLEREADMLTTAICEDPRLVAIVRHAPVIHQVIRGGLMRWAAEEAGRKATGQAVLEDV